MTDKLSSSRNDADSFGQGTASLQLDGQWFYRGNKSNVWFATYRKGEGLADRVPSLCWPFLEEIARLRAASSERAKLTVPEVINVMSAEQDAEDAERYRWLRDHDPVGFLWTTFGIEAGRNPEDEIDAAIDKAMNTYRHRGANE